MEFTAVAPIPTMWGPFKAYCFKSLLDGVEHIAMVKVIEPNPHLKLISLYLILNFDKNHREKSEMGSMFW